MNPDAFRAFTRALLTRLEADPRVLGLVTLGSASERGTEPDEHSDHDFFVVTASGAQEAFRTDLAWLPPHAPVVLSFRETAHGLKVVYEDGHLLEFAVFDLDELRLARVNRFRVLLDRGGVAERLAEVAETTAAESAGRSDAALAAAFLCDVLVGASRAARGELLSGSRRVGDAAVPLAALLARHGAASGDAALLDDLDPLRRFERVFPELARELRDALSREPCAAAAALLDVFERELGPRLPDFPARGLAAVRRRVAAIS